LNHERKILERNEEIQLLQIAHGRCGDKGDAANIGIIAYDDKGYAIIEST
jgi:hypothetical protein